MKDIIRENYRVWFPVDLGPSKAETDNADVHVHLKNGEHYFATFITIRNIEWLFKKNRATGECASGLYLWCCDMIIVERLTEDAVIRTIDDLLEQGEFRGAFDGPLDE
ncbi:MAG: hypothetical protein O7D94_07935 [Planctomycetota bacterium]|nr:hypothetical protein [Planctomycetota bacterium]